VSTPRPAPGDGDEEPLVGGDADAEPQQGAAPTGTVAPGDLLADVDVRPDPARPGRWRAELPPAWNVFYVFGGVTMATALRAAERALGREDLVPLGAHATFCAPVPAGAVVVDTEVLRPGRSAAQVAADVRIGDGELALRLTATFGQRHEAPVAYTGIDFPAGVLAPEASPERPASRAPDDPFPPINFHEQTDWRPAMEGVRFFDPDAPPGPARFASWFRLRTEARRADGTWDPVALCVPGDMLGPAVARPLGGVARSRPFLILSLDIDLQFVADTDAEWILQHVVVQHAGDGYALGTTELWDDRRRLVALATQRARLRPFAPPPVPR
jgi:acyl-CoA thioesterase